jgi:hypothetical protein
MVVAHRLLGGGCGDGCGPGPEALLRVPARRKAAAGLHPLPRQVSTRLCVCRVSCVACRVCCRVCCVSCSPLTIFCWYLHVQVPRGRGSAGRQDRLRRFDHARAPPARRALRPSALSAYPGSLTTLAIARLHLLLFINYLFVFLFT